MRAAASLADYRLGRACSRWGQRLGIGSQVFYFYRVLSISKNPNFFSLLPRTACSASQRSAAHARRPAKVRQADIDASARSSGAARGPALQKKRKN